MQRACIHLGAVMGILAAALAIAPTVCLAIVLHEGTTEPTVRPEDEAVARWGTNASCVVVAPNHVITTLHQGGGVGLSIDHDGDPATDPYIVAEIFEHGQADLRVARLVDAGGADATLSYTIDPNMGTDEDDYDAVIGGYGKGRGDNLISGDIHYGYEWAGNGNTTLRWGENAITNDTSGNSDGYVTNVLYADFDRAGAPSALPGEAATGEYDSGGGWFINVGTRKAPDWRVAGLARGVAHFGESWFRQPSGDPPGDYFDAVRISSYADWVNGILHPYAWAVDAGGAWSAAANWADDGFWTDAYPNDADRWAVFGDTLTAGRTITLDEDVTLGTLRIESSQPYVVAGTVKLIFQSNDNTFATLDVNPMLTDGLDALHRIEAPIQLSSPLVLTQESDLPLTLAGGVSGSVGITKRGQGEVIFTADSDGFTGGITVQGGTVSATEPKALGVGTVTMTTGKLKLISDADITYVNRISATSSTTLRAEPATVGAADHTLSVGSLSVLAGAYGLTLVTSGTAGYELAVDGQTNLTGDITFYTASAHLTLAGGVSFASGTLTKTGTRTLTVEGARYFGQGTAIDVENGTVRLNVDAGAAGDPRLTVRVNAAGAAVVFDAPEHLEGLVLEAGEASCLPHGGHTLVTDVLDIGEDAGDPIACLDLADNNLIVNYEAGASPYVDVADWVIAGFNGGAWNGLGIASSAANAVDYALAVADNSDPDLTTLTEMEGEPVDATSVLVRYTFYADANLDGQLDAADVNALVLSFGGLMTDPTPRWTTCDFNYDGLVDAADVNLLVLGFANHAGETLAGGAPEALPAPPAAQPETALDLADAGDDAFVIPTTVYVVPDPASVALLVGGGMAVLWRRRRRAPLARARG